MKTRTEAEWQGLVQRVRGRESELLNKILNRRTPAAELEALRAEYWGIRWVLDEERKET